MKVPAAVLITDLRFGDSDGDGKTDIAVNDDKGRLGAQVGRSSPPFDSRPRRVRSNRP
jgi:hypothetical protein